jgi:hypothetical protein
MFRSTITIVSILFLEACVPYFTTHWPEEMPGFSQDKEECSDQVLQAYGDSDKSKIEDCLVARGWSREREWDVVFLPIGGSAGM